MKPFRRLSVAEQAEQSLRALIRGGAWSSKLPPVRVLADQMGISIPPLLLALKALKQSGELVKGEGTRPYTIGKTPPKVRKARKALLVLADSGSAGLTGADLRLLDLLREKLAKNGTALKLERLEFPRQRGPSARWDKIVDQADPSHLAIIRGDQLQLDRAQARGLPTLLIGSRDGSGEDRKLAVKLGRLVDRVVPELAGLGHQRILLLLSSPSPKGSRFLSERLAAGVGTEPAVVRREEWVRYIGEGDREERGQRLLKAVRELRATAVLAVRWEDYLLTQSALSAAGLRVPTDVSMACCSHAPDMAHVIPAPAHFVIPEAEFSKGILNWMRTGKVAPDRLTQLTLKNWTPGGSIGKAP